MKVVVIRSPIWKTRSVGVADWKITEDLLIRIDYKDRSGNKVFKDFTVTRDIAKRCPTQKVGPTGLLLRIIPIPTEAGGL